MFYQSSFLAAIVAINVCLCLCLVLSLTCTWAVAAPVCTAAWNPCSEFETAKLSCPWTLSGYPRSSGLAGLAGGRTCSLLRSDPSRSRPVVCVHVYTAFIVSSDRLNPFKPMTPNGYTSKRSWPYWSNPPFLIFLTFGHSGAQDWAPECPNVKKLKMAS